jgi:hypothetical protein
MQRAEREAVARFGDPAHIARQLRRAHRPRLRSVAGACLTGGLGLAPGSAL